MLKIQEYIKNKLCIGIITMNKPQRLKRTLESYKIFFDMGLEIRIHIDCDSTEELQVAKEYVPDDHITFGEHIGISEGFLKICQSTFKPIVLLLENDWQLIVDNNDIVLDRILDGISFINFAPTFSVVRYRHKEEPGEPLYTRQFRNREHVQFSHLLDAVHWRDDLHTAFSDKVSARPGAASAEPYWFTSTKYANFTNNPCMYSTLFYKNLITPFSGPGVALEGNIQKPWEEMEKIFVYQGTGLFKHDG